MVPVQILDLTSKQMRFELGVEDGELLGRKGARLIADLKERATEAEYTHMYYRDPIRPGIIWFSALNPSGLDLPARGKIEYCRDVANKVFPDFLDSLQDEAEESIMARIPPLVIGASGVDLVTTLEYLVFVYPGMVRAWAALIFSYSEVLGLKESAEAARSDCAEHCAHAQIVTYLMMS
ncbi:MAG: hypothetical protein HYW49_13835 [Deltaproteobacteria bacterium]|nr:hypothetical protein [Deltaproteobacteria bacterium]